MAGFDPTTAVPADQPDFDPSTAQPYEERGALGEIGTAAKRGLFQGIQGAGAVLQTPAERAKQEPGIVSRFGQSLESFGKEHAAANPAQPEDHNPVTNFLAQAAEAPGSTLPLLAGAIPGSVAGAAVAGPVGAAIGGAVGGGGAAALQTWHDKYHEGLEKKLPDEEARAYADKSAVASGLEMGALSALPGAGSLAGKAMGAGAKTAVAAGTDVVGKKLLPEFGKSAAGMTAANTGLGIAGAAEQAKIDQEAGLQTPSPWEAAKAAAFPSLAGAAGFLPLSALHAVRTVGESKKIGEQLANPDAHPLARTRAAGAVYEAMEKADPEGTQMWAINAREAIKSGKPIGLDSSWTDGPHPSVFPEAVPETKALPAPGGLSGDATITPGEGPNPLTEQHAGNNAADNAAQIYGARDAEEQRLAGLQQSEPPAGEQGLLPAPKPVIPSESFDLAAQHGANNASDHAAAIEAARAQEEARLAQFASHGPLSAAAVAGVRSGAVEAAGQQRLTEIPASKTAGKPAEGLHENITAFARNTEPLPLHEAQARAAAIGDAGHDYSVVPHPQGSGYAIIPDRLLTPKIIEQYRGLQTAQEAKPSLMPFSTPEIARARADELTQSTGQEHEVVPHPRAREKYMVQPKPIDVTGETDAIQKQGAAGLGPHAGGNEGAGRNSEGRGVGLGEQGQEAASKGSKTGTQGAGEGLHQDVGDAVQKLESMRPEIGWAQRGGELIRDTQHYTSSDLAADGSPLKGAGAVTGRTKWIPKSDLWPSRPDKSLSEKQAHIAIDKATAGIMLSPKEQRFVDHANKIADEQRDFDIMTPPEQEVAHDAQDDWSLGGKAMTDEEVDKWLAGETGETAAGAAGKDQGAAEKDHPASFDLEQQSNADVLASEAKIKAAQDEKVKADTAAEQKAKADREREGFDLTGSERAADANKDQKPLLVDPAPTPTRGPIDINAGALTHAEVGPEIAKFFGTPPKELAGDKIRQVPPEGQRIIAAAVGDITEKLKLPKSFLDGLTSFHTYDEGAAGQYFPGARSVGVNAAVLSAINGGDRAWAQLLRGMLVHELMHHVDSDGDGRFSSARSAAFEIRIGADGGRLPTGGIVAEAMKAYVYGPPSLKSFLGYPLRNWREKAGDPFYTDVLKEEIFAQLGRLYFTNPGLLREHLPLAHALFKDIHDATIQADSIDAARRAVQQTVRSLGADGRPPRRFGSGDRQADQRRAAVEQAGPRVGEHADNKRELQRPDIAGERARTGSEDVGDAGRLSEKRAVDAGTADEVGKFSSADAATLLASNPARAPFSEFGDKVRGRVEDLLTSHSTFNILNRTLNTQLHKAEKNETTKQWYRPVFDKVQAYLNTASRLMMDSAEKAPDLLPQLDSIKDVLPKWAGGRGLDKSDIKNVSDAVFNGTLENKVYSDEQLRAKGLNDKQVGLYHQAREAIDKSLTDTFMSEAARQAKDLLPKTVIDEAVKAGDPWKIVEALADRGKEAKDVYDLLRERAAKVEDLKRNAYAPLSRFGKFYVEGQTKEGERSFTLHENERDANSLARSMRGDGIDVKQGVMSQEKWKLFQAVSPDTLELFADAVGASEKEIFQEYLAKAVNNRSVLKRLMQRKGIAGYENDIQRSLAQFLTSNGRAAARNYHWGDVSKLVDQIPKEHGDIIDEAVKLKEFVENGHSDWSGPVRGALFVNFLGGSVASGIVNATQPVLMTFPYLAQFGGARKAGAALIGAGKIAAGAKPTEPGLAAAMARATKEGIIAPHEVAGLYAEAIRNFGSNLAVRKGLKAWGSIFAVTEAFNRRITFVAAYRMGKANGVEDAFAFAEKAVQHTQGIYNVGNRANIARGPVGAILFTFKQYSVAYVELLKRLPGPQRALALATLVAASGVQGVPFAQDAENALDTIMQALGYNFNSAEKMRTWSAKVLGESLGGFAYQGASNMPGSPIDISQRLGVGNLWPGSGMFKRSTTDKTQDVLQWFGATGSAANSLMQAFTAAQEGRWDLAKRVGYPVALQNAMKGADMATSGYYRDTKGRRVIDTTGPDAIAKALGFQPAKVANESEKMRQFQQDINLQNDVRTNVVARWAQGIVEHDPAMIEEARAKLVEWNLKNPSSRVVVTPLAVQHQVQASLATRQQRFLKAAPKQDRGAMGQELRSQ